MLIEGIFSLSVIYNEFHDVRRATAQSKIFFLSGCGLAEDSRVFQAGWSECMYFFISFVRIVAHLEFPQ
jgi:hypothetical protein